MTHYQDALNQLEKGQIGLVPCDTLWGIVGKLSPGVYKRLNDLKGRPQTMGVIILISSLSMLSELTAPLSQETVAIVTQYWPGPITFILPKHPALSKAVTGGKETVAIRWPDHAGLTMLSQKLNSPLLSTSANKHGHTTPTTVDEIDTQLRDKVAFSLDIEDHKMEHSPSTIIDLTVDPPMCIRKGAIDWTQLH